MSSQVTGTGLWSSAARMSPHQHFTGIKKLGEEEPEGVSTSVTGWTPQTSSESFCLFYFMGFLLCVQASQDHLHTFLIITSKCVCMVLAEKMHVKVSCMVPIPSSSLKIPEYINTCMQICFISQVKQFVSVCQCIEAFKFLHDTFDCWTGHGFQMICAFMNQAKGPVS